MAVDFKHDSAAVRGVRDEVHERVLRWTRIEDGLRSQKLVQRERGRRRTKLKASVCCLIVITTTTGNVERCDNVMDKNDVCVVLPVPKHGCVTAENKGCGRENQWDGPLKEGMMRVLLDLLSLLLLLLLFVMMMHGGLNDKADFT